MTTPCERPQTMENMKIQNYEHLKNGKKSICKLSSQLKNYFLICYEKIKEMQYSILDIFEKVVFCMFDGCLRAFTTIKRC